MREQKGSLGGMGQDSNGTFEQQKIKVQTLGKMNITHHDHRGHLQSLHNLKNFFCAKFIFIFQIHRKTAIKTSK